MKIEMVIYEVNKCVGNSYFRSYLNYFGEQQTPIATIS